MYYIQITSFDLRHEETVVQAINTLDYLQASIDNAFDKIDARICNNKQKIDSMQYRIDIAAAKVARIFTSNKAVKLFGPPKFPAVNVLVDISSTFGVLSTSFPELLLDYDVEHKQLQSNTGFQNKLEFFHVKNPHKNVALSKVLFEKNEGFSIPNYLKYVNTTLLFNVYQKVYDAKHSGSRNLLLNKDKEKVSMKIVAAPTSITNRQFIDKFNIELLYIPKLNGAPHINLPLDLPDLPGIADDVQFECKEESKIAPSYIENIERSIASKVLYTTPKDIPSLPLQIEPNIITEVTRNCIIDYIIQQPPTASPHPPPPPPIPSSSYISPIEPKKLRKDNATNNISQNTEARSNLMDAIRNAGGAMGSQLRPSVDIQKKTYLKNETDNENNLINDLHSKLVMRRKGISGTRLKNESVIQRLSELMPSPPPQRNSSPDSSEDDEWK